MTKEEVLQKVTDYCNEKSYTNATLTDAFRNKFAEHFQKANAEADINDEAIVASLKFAINTAWSSASDIVTMKATEFATKENEWQTKIAELEAKIGKQTPPPTPPTPPVVEIPKEVKEQLEELKAYKDEKNKREKFDRIAELAKKEIRQSLHASFDKFAKRCEIDLNKEDKEQADAWRAEFQEIFKDTIGDVKPLTPVQTKKVYEDVIASIPKVKV